MPPTPECFSWCRCARSPGRKSVTSGLTKSTVSRRASSTDAPLTFDPLVEHGPRSADIKQVLAWVDGTDNDWTVLDHALQLALRFGSHIDVLHVRFDVSAAKGSGRRLDSLDISVDQA